MSRALRLHYPHANYHVSSRVSTQHKELFRSQSDRKIFLGVIADAVRVFGIKIYAYHLGAKEYHLLLSTPRSNLSRAIRHVNSVYSQYYNRTYKKTGQLFGGRYRAVLFDAETYVLDLIKFVHQGCSERKSGTTADPCDSSAYYAAHDEEIPGWLATHEALILLCPEYGANISAAYEAFRQAPVSAPVVNFYKRTRHGTVLGSDEFVKNLSVQLRDPLAREALLWNSGKHHAYMEVPRVIERLKQFYGIRDSELYFSKRRVPNEYRKAAVYLLKLWGYTYSKIMKVLRYNTSVAVSYVYRVFSQEINSSPELAREIQSLKEFIEKE